MERAPSKTPANDEIQKVKIFRYALLPSDGRGGPRNYFFPTQCARSAHRERVSAKLNVGGVQGPALLPLAGCRGRAPGVQAGADPPGALES